jgi:hypothetical protein
MTTKKQPKTLEQKVTEWNNAADRNFNEVAEHLKEELAGKTDPSYIYTWATRLKEADGRRSVFRMMSYAMAQNEHIDHAPQERMVRAFEEAMALALLQGADDSWSGRENDGNRAYYDGVRKAWNIFHDWVRFSDK